MKKIYATIIKEWILLKRDMAGFMLLFIMPAILIIVMALVQDAPFKDYQEMHFDLLMADNDHGSLSKEIQTGLRESKNFTIIDSINGKPLTAEKLQQLLKDGEYRVGIVIPKGATAEVVNAANIVANSLAKKIGIGSLPSREVRDNAYIRMYFDPATKPTFRASISNALDKFITFSCSNMLVSRLAKLGAPATDTTAEEQQDFKKVFKGIGIKEEALAGKEYLQSINSVQHNVPAWAIFGMFFIVIPIVSHVIREREEGSSLRIQIIPRAHRFVTAGKILFNTLLCSLQFACMLCIGVWALPYLDLPALSLGAHPWVLIPVTLFIGFAATSFGYFAAAIFKTVNQALPFASIIIVIFSAMGGIWVPIELMPGMMQKVALISPLHWSLDAINQVILRNGNIGDVALHLGVLWGFGTVLWFASMYINGRRDHSF
ncbi:MAG: ABC transporter permease [Sphingobacteriales bacterium]|nr:MAG: ABC transporter permease [Sphingobacteriales bacterium]